MKLLILHLSDLHFTRSNNYDKDNITSIVATINSYAQEIENILIIVSGDLAFSGKKEEYTRIERFFRQINRSIAGRYNIQCIRIVIVPGNHDVDYDCGDRGRKGLNDIESENMYDSEISEEIKKQSEFYNLSQKYNCFTNKNLLHQKTISFGDKKVQINLVNTAVFSSKDEDQGFHYLPEKDITRLAEQNDADYVFSVMHHPHHWYTPKCKKRLEEALYSRSDLVFVGHEHYESDMTISKNESTVNIFSGGELCNKGDWSNSEFHIAVLDLNTREYTSHNYRLNLKAGVYEETGEVRELTLSKDRFNQYGLIVRSDYKMKLNEDRFLISSSDLDYFVFPLLEEQVFDDERRQLPREITSMKSFIEALNDADRIIISGTNDSGKSILARAIFEELSKTHITIIIRGADIGSNFRRTIKNAFEEIYSEKQSEYETFRQAKKQHRAIIIDDANSIDSARQDEFIDYINERFGIVVETCLSEIDVDIKKRLKRRNNFRDYSIYCIAPFYLNKRRELVTKIVQKTASILPNTQEQVINVLCDVLTKQKYLYGWNPEFIVQFTKFYCNNIGDSMQNDGSVFSKVFESNITQLIKPYAKRITVDKVLMVLDKIAFGVYVHKKYPFFLEDIGFIIQEYNCIYDSHIETRQFVNLLIDARILRQTEKGYVFYDRNYLSYFTAREVKRKCLEDNDYTQLNHVMKYCYSPLNSDILLFITYITDNLNIIRMIMDLAEETMREWNEFDLRSIDISFLINPVEQIVRPVEDADREIEEKRRIDEEKTEAQLVSLSNDASVFYGENEELDHLKTVIRSISLMIIMSRTLPSFEHLMKREDKEKCVNLIYRMPLTIFNVLAQEIDKQSYELINEIKILHETEFRKDKPRVPPLEDKQALYILKWEATSMLLDLIYASVGGATRDNTNEYLDRFNYHSSPTYGIEHLIGLARRDSVALFSDEAEHIYLSENESLTKTIVQRITRNYIINSKKMKPSEIQSLNARIFDQRIPNNRLLIEKKRSKEKQ